MDNTNTNFEDWHRELCRIAREHGGSAADAEGWREVYEAGKTPEQAWADEWGE